MLDQLDSDQCLSSFVICKYCFIRIQPSTGDLFYNSSLLSDYLYAFIKVKKLVEIWKWHYKLYESNLNHSVPNTGEYYIEIDTGIGWRIENLESLILNCCGAAERVVLNIFQTIHYVNEKRMIYSGGSSSKWHQIWFTVFNDEKKKESCVYEWLEESNKGFHSFFSMSRINRKTQEVLNQIIL